MEVTTDESVSGTEEEGGRPEAGTAQPKLHTNSPTSQALARSLGTSFRRVPSHQPSSFLFLAGLLLRYPTDRGRNL